MTWNCSTSYRNELRKMPCIRNLFRRAFLASAVLAVASPVKRSQPMVLSQRPPTLPDSIDLTEAGLTAPDQMAVAGNRYAWMSGPRQGLVVADLQSGVVRKVGRAGAGPGEYRAVSRTFGCSARAGWIDAQLMRITWLAPDGSGEPAMDRVPAAVLVRGNVEGAVCQGDTLYAAVSRQGGSPDREIRDSVMVFRMVRGSEAVDAVLRVAGTRRIQRAKGALRASARQPYSAPPLLLNAAGALVLLDRISDTVWNLNAAGTSAFPVAGARAAPTLTATHMRLIRDSIQAWVEDEMRTLNYSPELRREFRLLHAEVLASIALPARVPRVRLAAPSADSPDLIQVVENDVPGSARICTSLLRRTGTLIPGDCRDRPDRHVSALGSTSDQTWYLEWNNDGAWLRRQATPKR